MKKILLFTVLTFAGTCAFGQGQLGNGDMESWANNDEPDNWNSFLTASGNFSGFAQNQCESSTDVRPGSLGTSSCRIWAKTILTTTANGNVTLGQINMGATSPTSSSNYNVSVTSDSEFSEAFTDMPDSIVYWVKYTPNGGSDNARMKATLHADYDYRDPEDASSAVEVVATAIDNYPSTQGSWERHAIAFDYSAGPASTVAYILVTFTTNENAGQGANNDEVLIDDVELIYNPDNNNGLEENENDGIVVSMDNNSNTINFNSVSDLSGDYVVYNTLGQSIQSGAVSSEVDFDAKSGVYFVHLNANNKFYTFEILKN